jgi:hypothetical protein
MYFISEIRRRRAGWWGECQTFVMSGWRAFDDSRWILSVVLGLGDKMSPYHDRYPLIALLDQPFPTLLHRRRHRGPSKKKVQRLVWGGIRHTTIRPAACIIQPSTTKNSCSCGFLISHSGSSSLLFTHQKRPVIAPRIVNPLPRRITAQPRPPSRSDERAITISSSI